MKLNIYRIAYPVSALGPGDRIVLWVSGCNKRCSGCISPEIQDSNSGKLIEVSSLLNHLLGLSIHIDGITISGGEPFDQPMALMELLSGLKIKRPTWSAIVYSGFTLSELLQKEAITGQLLNFIDVLIDGPYDQETLPVHPLAGSGNQKLHYLSERGRSLQKGIASIPANIVNLGISNDPGKMLLIGILSPDMRQKIHTTIGLLKS